MELWIRSQDKNKLCVAKFFELDNDKTGIFCFNGESYSIFAGKYKSKERALEVLDEIQEIIKWCQKDMKDVTIVDMENLKGCFYDFVYEMPKE